MSGVAPGALGQHAGPAAEFLAARQTLLRLIDAQEEQLRRLFERHAHRVGRFDHYDRADPACSRLRWLEEAGFEDAELHFKWAEAAVCGAVKPAG